LIIEKRLSMCMEKLSNPACNSLTVTEIAYQAGFSNSAHFSTRFRKQYGLSPREARLAQGIG
jgi:AraC-like DNA-binding protein